MADLSGHFYIFDVRISDDPDFKDPKFKVTDPAGIFPLAELIKMIILA